ncbi:uncharacterized protein F4822DRAFT_3185 [Hypoxylon trugodes]|uniref:uncharacterized protein n=1 Tax=Hypoxylon trugodes TaxID=326681 RepID=UPI0021A15934|nr:uncharacterized protein F4822DRAFT_3185 [Hypoxylon trugodes]KAI1393187.1 hypothetical protein F4822DRAFT_3185 [Hypoxylon trugodes]
MPKPHTKSRFGCKECKRRKIKCDEVRPSCTRCTNLGRQCLYLAAFSVSTLPTLPTLPTTLHSSTEPSRECTPSTSLCTSQSSPPETISTTSAPSYVLVESYSLFHMELLNHLKNQMVKLVQPIHIELSQLFDLAYEEALKIPYLMDELIAFSAAHKSTLTGESQSSYRIESTRLQTRALNQFHTQSPEVTDDNCLALFVFSTILGQHVLFDALSASLELSTVLDKLTQCIDIHHGIRAVAGQSWQKVSIIFRDRISLDLAYAGKDIAATSGIECDNLLQRLGEEVSDQPTLRVYVEAVKILQYLFDSLHSSDARRFVVVQEWLVRVSKQYTQCLRQRRPEALVILAYFAVLLHRASDYWVVGQSGRFIIKAITSHLGPYWTDWLEWPNRSVWKVN